MPTRETLRNHIAGALTYGAIYSLGLMSVHRALGLRFPVQDVLPLSVVVGAVLVMAGYLLEPVAGLVPGIGRKHGPGARTAGPTMSCFVSGVLILLLLSCADGLRRPGPWLGPLLILATAITALYAIFHFQRRRFTLVRSVPLFILVSLLSSSTTVLSRIDPSLVEQIMAPGISSEEVNATTGRPRAVAGAHRENIVIIVLDTVRAESMELFGYHRETMPNLTAFARRRATHVARIEATAPATLPTHASIFTGHYPHSHGAHKAFLDDPAPPAYAYPLGRDLPTLAGVLGRHGYSTVGFAANFGVLSGYGISRGFDVFDVRESDLSIIRRTSPVHRALFQKTLSLKAVHRLLAPLLARFPSFDPLRPPYRTAEEMTDLAIEYLDHHAGAPFFLFLNYFDAHDPYLPPRRSRNFSAGYPRPEWSGFPADRFDRYLVGGEAVPVEDVRHARNLYDDELSYLDTHLSRVLDRVTGSDLAEGTILIITSDHGESFMEQGMMLHSSQLCSQQIDVPLVMWIPGREGGAPVPVPGSFQHVDLMPTLLQHLGIDVPAGCQGSAWGAGRDHSMAELFVHDLYRDIPGFKRELCSVTRRGVKTVFCRDESGVTSRGEEAPLGTQARDVYRQRNAVMDRRRADNRIGSPAESEALIDRLQRLGYVE